MSLKVACHCKSYCCHSLINDLCHGKTKGTDVCYYQDIIILWPIEKNNEDKYFSSNFNSQNSEAY